MGYPIRALTIHAAVLSDPHDEADGEALARAVSARLEGAASFEVVEPVEVSTRLGVEPGDLFVRCGEDERCWRTAAGAMLVEQVVLVEKLGDGQVGLRTLDTIGREPFRRASGDEVLLDALVDHLFVGRAVIRVDVAVGEREVVVDGVPQGMVSTVALEVAAGKHTVEVLGEPRSFTWVILPPGGELVVSPEGRAIDHRAGAGAAAFTAVLVVGLLGLVASASAPGIAR